MPTARPILIVEDDPSQTALLAEALTAEQEFAVSAAATLSDADALFSASDVRFDAVILDLGMPDGDGHAYCAKLRAQGHKMPIIFVTGSSHEADVVRGLDSGANDYVAKPFRFGELLARLRAQLRIFDNSGDAVLTVGPYAFRPAAKLLLDQVAKRRVRLTDKETAVLKFLYRSGARPVPRAVLLDEVWGYKSGITTHTLETHIYRLRQKIEPNPADHRLLVSESGGYRLNSAMPA